MLNSRLRWHEVHQARSPQRALPSCAISGAPIPCAARPRTRRWPAATGARSTCTSGCAGGAGPEDAQDLTQEFFTRAFEREYLSRYDPAKARFRTFVRTCLDGFLANEDKAAARLKRGGG